MVTQNTPANSFGIRGGVVILLQLDTKIFNALPFVLSFIFSSIYLIFRRIVSFVSFITLYLREGRTRVLSLICSEMSNCLEIFV